MVPQFTFGAGTGKRPPPAAAIACGGAKAKQLLEVGLDALEVEEDHGAVGCSGSHRHLQIGSIDHVKVLSLLLFSTAYTKKTLKATPTN